MKPFTAPWGQSLTGGPLFFVTILGASALQPPPLSLLLTVSLRWNQVAPLASFSLGMGTAPLSPASLTRPCLANKNSYDQGIANALLQSPDFQATFPTLFTNSSLQGAVLGFCASLSLLTQLQRLTEG